MFVTEAPGYLIRAEPEALDAARFEARLARTKMDKDTTSQLSTWHRTGFGRRVLKSQPPYFVISPLS